MDSEKQNESQQNQHLQYSKKEKQLLLDIVYDIPLSESTEKLGFEDDIHNNTINVLGVRDDEMM